MKHTIKLLFLNIFLCSAPALQAMGTVRSFGARAFKAASASAAKFKMNAQAFRGMAHKQSVAKPFGFKNGGKQGGYKKFAHTAAVMPLVKVGALYGVYDKVKEWLGYDAPIPADIKKVLDEHAEELEFTEPGKWWKVTTFDWLPGWVVKKDHHHKRIKGAKKINAVIKELGCSSLMVPTKYRYISPTGRDFTISQEIKPSQEKITLEELKEIIQVTIKLCWWDCHSGNIMKTVENKIAFIDTEPCFGGDKNYCVSNLYRLPLTEEAQVYLRMQYPHLFKTVHS